jgi:hypothetical protein
MPNISLTDYSSAAAQAARQQQMAQALQEQAQAPIQVSTYEGFQAPISPLSGIAKMLQAYTGAKMERDAQKKLEEARTSDSAALMKLLGVGSTEGATVAPAPAAAPAMATSPAGPSNPAYTGPMPNNADLVSALKGGLSGPVGQPVVPPETPPAAGPSQMAMASALAGKPAQAPVQPSGGMVPDPAALPPVAPVAAPVASKQSDVMTRLAADKALAEKLTLGLASPALSPTSKAVVASQLKTVTDRISDTQKMFDKSELDSTTKEADRVAEVGRAVKAVDGLSVPDNVKDTMRNLAQNFGESGIKPYMDLLAKNQLGPHEKYMTPEEMAQHGVPLGSVAQYDDQTGKLTILINGHTVANEDRNLALRGREVAISGANYGLNERKFAADQDAKANAVLDPATLNQMALQARAGDTSVFQNLGRGTQGAQNIVNLRRAIFDSGLPPMTGAQLAQMNANFQGVKAEQRTIGGRAGAGDIAVTELIPQTALSNEAYAKLPRGQFMPFNKLRAAVATQTNSPEQAAAYAADMAVISAYARARSPNGIGRVDDIKHGEQLLSSAQSQEAHAAVLVQMNKEAAAIKQGAHDAMGGGNAPKVRTYNRATGKLE